MSDMYDLLRAYDEARHEAMKNTIEQHNRSHTNMAKAKPKVKVKSDVYRYIVMEHVDKEYYYTITKSLKGEVLETYTVYLHPADPDNVFCNCPGFQVQKYPKPQHKHVLLAVDFRARVRGGWIELFGEFQLELKTNKVIFKGGDDK